MKFPFVSRERLEEVQRQLQSSENERHLLLDRLALLRGEPPIFATPAATVVSVPVPEDAAAPMRVATHTEAAAEKPAAAATKTLAGSVTFDAVLAAAEKAGRPNGTGSWRTH